MASDEIRLAQLIQTFGPGSIVDLPKSSVMIRGLGAWPNYKPRKIRERRLVFYLKKLLENAEGGSWLADGAELELWEPPLNEEAVNRGDAPTVPAVIFPRWVTLSNAEDTQPSPQSTSLNDTLRTSAGAAEQQKRRFAGSAPARTDTSKTSIGDGSFMATRPTTVASRTCGSKIEARVATLSTSK